MNTYFSVTRSVNGAYHNEKTTLDKCVSIMRGSIKLHELCDKYKHFMAIGKIGKAKHIKKTCIPAIFTNALMFGGKSREHVVGLTGYGIIDIDHIPENRMADVIKKLTAIPHLVLIVRSISGKGIHIIFRYHFVDRKIPSRADMTPKQLNSTYIKVAKRIGNDISTHINFPIDPQCYNMERTMLLSYDPKLIYNPQAEPFVIKADGTNWAERPIERSSVGRRYNYPPLNTSAMPLHLPWQWWHWCVPLSMSQH